MNAPKIVNIQSIKEKKIDYSFFIPSHVKLNSKGIEILNKDGFPKMVDAEIKYHLLTLQLEKFFLKTYSGENDLYFYINGKILQLSNRDKIKDFFRTKFRSDNKIELLELISQPRFYGFSQEQIKNILPIEYETIKDSRDETFLFYSNGFIRIDKDGSTFKEYDSIENGKYVYESQFCTDTTGEHRKHIEGGNYKNSEIYKLLKIVCGESELKVKENQRRLKYKEEETKNSIPLMTAIGYLINNHKRKDLNKMINLYERDYSEDAQGGTGKSALLECLKYTRNVLFENGKSIDFDNRFVFQRANEFTQLIYFDDLKRGFQLEPIFSVLSDGITIEKKGKNPFKPINPVKFCSSSNNPIRANGDSAKRRIEEYPIYKFFDTKLSIYDVFKKELYYDFKEEEWGNFDSFIIECVKLFHLHGLVSSPVDPVAEENKLKHSVGSDSLYEFFCSMVDFLSEKRKEELSKLPVFPSREYNGDNYYKIYRTEEKSKYLALAKEKHYSDYNVIKSSDRLFNQKFNSFLEANNIKHILKKDTGKDFTSTNRKYILIRIKDADKFTNSLNLQDTDS